VSDKSAQMAKIWGYMEIVDLLVAAGANRPT
jgi:hypothetical protein